MIRVVLDTNIVVSALLSPNGLPARLFLLAITDPDLQLCVSGEVFAEYEEVIRRPKLHRTDFEIEGALRAIREKSLWVKPSGQIRACSDPDDDIFLECAEAADAHYLITGNIKDFPAEWTKTQIVTARVFLDAVL